MKGCRPLTDKEILLIERGGFAGRMRGRDLALFVLGTRAGFRVSELLSLRVGDVWQGGRVVSHVTVRRQAMKGKREGRTVYMHPGAQQALYGWLCELRGLGCVKTDNHVFVRADCTGPISRQRAWQILKRAFRRAGCIGQLGTHTLRKTFARKISAAGADLVALQSALGHRNVNSTVQYTNFTRDATDELIRRAYDRG